MQYRTFFPGAIPTDEYKNIHSGDDLFGTLNRLALALLLFLLFSFESNAERKITVSKINYCLCNEEFNYINLFYNVFIPKNSKCYKTIFCYTKKIKNQNIGKYVVSEAREINSRNSNTVQNRDKYESNTHYRMRQESVWMENNLQLKDDTITLQNEKHITLKHPFYLLLSILCGAVILCFVIKPYHNIKNKNAVLNAQFQERNRIARELHDDLGSSLTSLEMSLDLLKSHPESEKYRKQIEDSILEMNQQMNDIIWRLDTENDYLQSLVSKVRVFSKEFLSKTSIQLHFYDGLERKNTALSGFARHTLFLCCKEILNNIVKHAHCDEVYISFLILEELLWIQIKDNGIGIENQKSESSTGRGLKNIRKSISTIGGDVEYIVQNGTTINIKIPIETLNKHN